MAPSQPPRHLAERTRVSVPVSALALHTALPTPQDWGIDRHPLPPGIQSSGYTIRYRALSDHNCMKLGINHKKRTGKKHHVEAKQQDPKLLGSMENQRKEKTCGGKRKYGTSDLWNAVKLERA